jgi:hypothetical protein
MGKKTQTSIMDSLSIPKRTTIGGGKIKTSSLNKHKRRSYKKYMGGTRKINHGKEVQKEKFKSVKIS